MTASIEARPDPDGAPETGQLVSVRDRRWVVTNVERSTQALDVLSGEPGRQEHLVTLTSVEDDGFGERLRVVWELGRWWVADALEQGGHDQEGVGGHGQGTQRYQERQRRTWR